MPSLDDQKLIRKHDRSDMLGMIESFPRQCEEAKKIALTLNIPDAYRISYNNIVFAGMGGSAIAADVLKTYLFNDASIPIFVNKGYSLPAFTGERTLVIVSSYSGNTEETISAYRDAIKRKAKIFVITSGGILQCRARKDGVPAVTIPRGLPPRCAIGYGFFPALTILSRIGIIKDKTRETDETIRMLDVLRREYIGCKVPEKKNLAKKIAKELYGKFPVIYATQDETDCAVTRWRSGLSENAKTLSSGHLFPEMAHNDIVGWKYPKGSLKNFVAVILRDASGHSRVSRKMDIARDIIKREGCRVIEVASSGRSRLARIFSLMYTGDYVSYYLAMLNGIDPTPVDRITYLKKALT